MIYMQTRLPISCFLTVLYCYLYYRAKKRLATRTSLAYKILTICALVHLAGASVTEYTVNNRDIVPEAFNYWWHVIYLTSLTATCCMVLFYLILCIEQCSGQRKRGLEHVTEAVGVIGVVAQIVLPISYVDTPNGSYSLGMKAYALYAVVIVVFLLLLINLIVYWKIIDRSKSVVLLASLVIFVVVSAVQIAFPHMLLTDVGITMLLLGLMVNMEDSHLYISYKTGLYNELGCEEVIREGLISAKPFSIGVYVFLGDDNAMWIAKKSIADRLPEKKCKVICGEMADNVLVVIPQATLSGTAGFPEELPQPVFEEGRLEYVLKKMDFTGKEEFGQIQAAVRECRNQFEEETLQKDGLTGLLRREAFIRQVEYFISLRQPFSFVMMDLDDLKYVNDTFGHGGGDQALVTVANAIKNTVRSSDVTCRMGGDEFWIALTGTTDPEQVREIVGRIVEKLESTPIFPDADYRARVSVGVRTFRPELGVPSFQELYSDADSALYRTKQAGKNGISFAS